MNITETTITQLGGQNKLVAMIGANTFSATGTNTLNFKFKGSKVANYVSISLVNDTYNLTFMKKFDVVKNIENVFVSDLINIFENTTKLRISL